MAVIKAVGFDYGGVIGGVESSGSAFTEKVCALLEIDKEQYRAIYFKYNHKINLGEIGSWREFWKIFLNDLGKFNQLEGLMLLSDEVQKNLRVIDADMVRMVDQIRDLGYETGLLSNTTLQGGENMRSQGLDKHFDVFDISAETKLTKPNPEAFRHFAKQLGVEPAQLAFIDDAEKSLSTAAECGFTPILFNGKDDLREQLTAKGVLPS